jgi:hypothetical protein
VTGVSPERAAYEADPWALQVGGNLVSPQPDKWWCDCDDMVGPHVHCVWGGRGQHMHAVEVPPDHREPKRGSRG